MDETMQLSSGEMQEVAEPATDIGVSEEMQEVAEPAVNGENGTVGKNDSDTAFANLRRERDSLQSQFDSMQKENARLTEALGMFFEGDDLPSQAIAYAQDRPVEEVIAEREAEERYNTVNAENESLKEQIQAMQVERLMAEGLKEIQSIDPTVKDLAELGDSFVEYISRGLTSVQAYFAVQAERKVNHIDKPLMPGRANEAPEEKEFFTSEEVDRMSEAEVKKNFDKIMESMRKW